MLGEITHLQTISEDLKSLTMDPHKLPSSSEQVRKLSGSRGGRGEGMGPAASRGSAGLCLAHVSHLGQALFTGLWNTLPYGLALIRTSPVTSSSCLHSNPVQ